MKPILACLFTCLLLQSCATKIHKKSEISKKLIDLSSVNAYHFKGKMSFSDGNEGGSGQVEWHRDQLNQQVTLKAPLSKKSWTLVETTQGAELKLANGQVGYDQSASKLISDQIGWPVPWEPMQKWVIGQATDTGVVTDLDNGEGFKINDQGWEIEYTRIKPYQSGFLPHKIVARKNAYSIKLIIKLWQW